MRAAALILMNSNSRATALFFNTIRRPCPINARIFQMLNNEKCLHISKKSRTFVGTNLNNITNQKSHIMETKLSKRELRAIVRNTIRNADLTTICRLYNYLTGKTPTIHHIPVGVNFGPKEVDYFAIKEWAQANGCDQHEVSRLLILIMDNERYIRRNRIDSQYKYSRHGIYKPNCMGEAMKILRRYIRDPRSPYAKRLIKGCTHLYAASPYFGHSDYNKYIVMRMAGHETFIDKIVGYCDKIQERVENNQGQ